MYFSSSKRRQRWKGKKKISSPWFIEPSKLDFMAVETLQSTAAFMLQLLASSEWIFQFRFFSRSANYQKVL